MVQCSICLKEFENSAGLGGHVAMLHSRSQLSECTVCGKKMRKRHIKLHQARCDRKHPCIHCGKITQNEKFCSRSCSQTTNNRIGSGYAAWRKNKGIVKKQSYKDVCFKTWKKACVICGWNVTVDVHHIDGNYKNDEPTNLIPLCANHHIMTRLSSYRDELQKQLAEISRMQHAPVA